MDYSWQTGVIEDGLDQPGFIAEVVGLHPACNFTFRPVTPEAWEGFESEKEKRSAKNAEQARAMIGEFLSKKIRSWDLTDSKGSVIPVSELACRKLRPILQFKLYRIVCGLEPTDINPNWLQSTGSDEFKSLESLQPIQEQIKNS